MIFSQTKYFHGVQYFVICNFSRRTLLSKTVWFDKLWIRELATPSQFHSSTSNFQRDDEGADDGDDDGDGDDGDDNDEGCGC